jgi:signal transduction histidine kinase/methanogenic corrinoid protein MtbC1
LAVDESWADRLLEVGRSLTSDLDQRVVFDRVLQTAREVTGARYAALGILNETGDGLTTFLTSGVDERTHAEIGDLPRGRGVLGVLITDPRPLRLGDVAVHPARHGFPKGHPTMRSFLGAPIMIAGRVWGNLYLTEKAAGLFTERDEQAAVILAGWAAIAIENARLYELSEQRRQRAERAMRALEVARDVLVEIGGPVDLARVLALVATRARELVSASSTVIWLRDGDELVLHAGAGQVGAGRTGARIVIADSEFDRALTLGRLVRVSATEGDGDLVAADVLGVAQGASALLAPMVVGERLVGALVAANDYLNSGGFTDDDEYVLSTFAASAANAVALAQSVAGDRMRGALAAAEAERTRWARDLHDETLQSLGGLRMLLGATLRRADDPSQTRETVTQAVEAVQSVIDGLRGLITELRPAALTELGLQAALEALLDRHRRRAGFQLTGRVHLMDPVDRGTRLDAEVESAAYRLVQEALSNIVKHAHAGRVRVTARESGTELEIEIADNGCGFDPGHAGGGFGLTGMRERVALAGGRMTINSSPRGTLLRASLPLIEAPDSAPAPLAAHRPSGRHDLTTSPRPPRTARPAATQDWSAYARHYVDGLRAADARRAQAVARDCLTTGLSLAELCARVITPAMHRIGELWARRALTVADEHAATAISHDVLASLKASIDGDPLELGVTVLLAAPEGERHGLGLRMSADVLETAGFHVIYLGIDVPVDSLIATIAGYRPALTGLSLTMPQPPAQIRALTDAITAAHPEGRMLIGGQGIPEWLRDDRITYIATVETLVADVDRILDAQSAAQPAKGGPPGARVGVVRG